MLLLVVLTLRAVLAQPGLGPGGMPLEAKPVYKSAKLIECVVCKAATEELWRQFTEAKEGRKQKMGEDEMQELTEELCNPDLDEGEWITFYDITQSEKGAALKIEKQEYVGECRKECRTIAKACATVYDEHREDVAEALYKQQETLTAEKLKGRLCTKWSGVCPAKKASDYEHPDEWWMPADEEMYKMKKMQQMINKQATKYGKQPVQFVDPIQSSMFMDEDEF